MISGINDILIEFFLYLPVDKRTTLIISYLIGLIAIIGYYVIIPLLGYTGIYRKLKRNNKK